MVQQSDCCASGLPQDNEECEGGEEEQKEDDECVDEGQSIESEPKEDVEKGTFQDCFAV